VIKDKNTEVTSPYNALTLPFRARTFVSVSIVHVFNADSLLSRVWSMQLSCVSCLVKQEDCDCIYIINNIKSCWFSVVHNGTDNKRHRQGIFPWKTYWFSGRGAGKQL